MRILHTADWHLGRIFNGFSLLEDQAILVEQIAEMVEEEKPELFILAGDVFDRANPRREAVELFDQFLERLYRNTRCALAVIAGNHDAPERIGFGGALHDPRRAVIRGGLGRSAGPLLLEDNQGTVAVSALPYAGVFAARDHFDEPGITNPDQVLAAQIAEARSLLPEDARQIIVSHTFVAGGAGSESERSLESAGGIEQVSPERYAGASYVAMGHLHRPQRITLQSGTLRYSGSIMPFGFDEVETEKSVTLLELEWWGVETLRTLPLSPPRPLRVLRGSFDELLSGGSEAEPGAFVKLELTDRLPVPDAMTRLRQSYPNAVQLDWINREILPSGERVGASREGLGDPEGVIRSFLADVGAGELSREQEAILQTAVAEAQKEDQEEPS
jgi:exonuclease SbcD